MHGRDLVLSALWATCGALDRPTSTTAMPAERSGAIACAVGKVTHQFSPTGRVLVVLQIADHTRQQLSAERADKYQRIAGMPLDRNAVRHGELPEDIALGAH